MSDIKVTLSNGAVKEVPVGTTIEQLAAVLGHSLRKRAVGGRVNGQLVDVYTPLTADAEVEIVTADSSVGRQLIRHSAAHLMAQAIKRVYGAERVRLGTGPVIADRFYYDVDVPEPITSENLRNIEDVMQQIVCENLPIRREVVSRADAVRVFSELGDDLKLELIRDLPGDAVLSLYRQGEFVDLCRGPHVPSTGWLNAHKLLSTGGAYWRGNANNKVLQRIYGTAFATKAELEEHLHLLNEAKLRDHRKLGKELDLFMFSEDAPGMPFYLPKGQIIRNALEDYERVLQVADYQEVRTPIMLNRRLWKQSGHWDHYPENMFIVDGEMDGEPFALKPMSCPGHMLIYKNKIRSYRDLPIRLSEFGLCHRRELSGALSGMMRVQEFTQDDAHLFVRPDQIEPEIHKIIALIDKVYSTFGFSYRLELSTRPENSMGSDELWQQAESALKNVLDDARLNYLVNEGDGAFYGPKIDFHIEDALKRSWQCGTIQLDFQLPERFDLAYVGEDNRRHRPVVIHRAIGGSIERFMGILTEHFAGAFPVWLAPVQVRVLPVADVHREAADVLRQRMVDAGIRAELDDRDEKVGYKIRDVERLRIPYAFVVGDKELANNTVSVRKRAVGDLGALLVAEMIERVLSEIRNRTL